MGLFVDMADVICAVDLHSYIRLAATGTDQSLSLGGRCC